MASNQTELIIPDTSAELYKPDPDIAGPGVILGFLLTGVLTFVASYTALYLQGCPNKSNRVKLLRRITPQLATDPVQFWVHILSTFVLHLSDQQLLTGLLLLVCGYTKYWDASVRHGADNLWTVTDIVSYSSFTHSATLLSLRPYFQRHHKLATARVVVMYTIYILWLIVAVHIIQPSHSEDPNKLPSIAGRFWRATMTIQILGIMWIYLSTYLPVFLSPESTAVRAIIARCSHSAEDLGTVEAWIDSATLKLSPNDPSISTWRKYNPRSILCPGARALAVIICRKYITTESRISRWFLCCLAELLLPWRTTGISLAILWAFSLGALIYSLIQNQLASSWGFGQLLPLFMILLPFQSLVTSLIGEPE